MNPAPTVAEPVVEAAPAKILYVAPTDFAVERFGAGGLAEAASAIRTIGDRFAYVGTCADSAHVGKWREAEVWGRVIRVFSVLSTDALATRRSGANLRFALALGRYARALKREGYDAVVTDTYSVLWVLALIRGWRICFRYPGVANPVRIGRLPRAGRLVSGLYTFFQSLAIRKADLVCAAASPEAIAEYTRGVRRWGVEKTIHPIPPGVDLDTFTPRNMEDARRKLGLPLEPPIFAFVGRLAAVKGVDFLLRSLAEFRLRHGPAHLLILGDGELRQQLWAEAGRLGIADLAHFRGNRPPREVALHVAASNASLVGSHVEGLSFAMLEEVACGRPIVSTAVSGAKQLIAEGTNGYVVVPRDPSLFADRMYDALSMPSATAYSQRLVTEHYCEKDRWAFILRMWH